MKKTALIVVDVQKFYHEFPALKPSVDLSLFAILPALKLFRETSNPVIFVNQVGEEFVQEGSRGFEVIDILDRRQNEPLVVKRYPNSFFKTDLAKILNEKEIGLVVVCGLAASKCVMATLQGAVENGFKTAFLQHGVADIKEALVQTPYEVYPAISVDVLKYFLDR